MKICCGRKGTYIALAIFSECLFSIDYFVIVYISLSKNGVFNSDKVGKRNQQLKMGIPNVVNCLNICQVIAHTLQDAKYST